MTVETKAELNALRVFTMIQTAVIVVSLGVVSTLTGVMVTKLSTTPGDVYKRIGNLEEKLDRRIETVDRQLYEIRDRLDGNDH